VEREILSSSRGRGQREEIETQEKEEKRGRREGGRVPGAWYSLEFGISSLHPKELSHPGMSSDEAKAREDQRIET
jgi:hypothetical protein